MVSIKGVLPKARNGTQCLRFVFLVKLFLFTNPSFYLRARKREKEGLYSRQALSESAPLNGDQFDEERSMGNTGDEGGGGGSLVRVICVFHRGSLTHCRACIVERSK